MDEQNAQAAEDSTASSPEMKWRDSVTAFEREAASWLTPADAPQLMALLAIAAELDGGSFQAALISQFTLVHRGLLARRPGNDAPSPPSGETLFEVLGGRWTADS